MNKPGASPASPPAEQATALPAGRLVENLMFFARTLRAAGLPIGPGRVAEALRAVEAVGISRYQTLNLVPLFGQNKTVEFRCFSGTTSGQKMTAWIQMALAVATLALARNTKFDAPATTYADTGTATGAMQRFFYLAGWTRGRKDYYKPVCIAEGWVDEMEALDAAKRELMRLAKKYDGKAA